MLFRSHLKRGDTKIIVSIELRKNRSMSRIESDYTKNKPEVKLITNKNRANDLGVSTENIGRTLETLYGGKRVTNFSKDGSKVKIKVENSKLKVR